MIEPYRSKAATGVKKALGQLKKVQSMLENEDYCMEVLQQVRAVEGLLNSVTGMVLESHLNSCAERAFSSKDKKAQNKIIQELVIAFKASKK